MTRMRHMIVLGSVLLEALATTSAAQPHASRPDQLSGLQRRVTGHVRYWKSALPVPSVMVCATFGADARTCALTDEDGRYDFSQPAGAFRLEAEKLNDRDAITALDASLILQLAGGARLPTTDQLFACDVDGKAGIAIIDASQVLKYRVSLLSRFSVAELYQSDFLFLPVPSGTSDRRFLPGVAIKGRSAPSAIEFDASEEAVTQDFRAILFGDCDGSWSPSSPAR